MFQKKNKIDFIPKSKGIAVGTPTKPHNYSISLKGESDKVNILIKTRTIKETVERVSNSPVPENYSDEVTLTSLSIIRVSDGSILFEVTVEGEADDEWVLGQFGYYVTSFDEENEVKKIRRLMDLSKYI